MLFSEVVGASPTGNERTNVKFAQYDNNLSPLIFSLSGIGALTDNTLYTWRIPLLKNPMTAYTALRYNLSLYSVSNSKPYLFLLNHHESINEYYTVADTSSVFTTALTNINRFVQTVNGIDLQISLGSGNSLPDGDVVVFKLDNSKNGLISDFTNGNDTTNYDYYYFHTINMVMAQKKTVNTIENVGIGSASDSINYKRDFGLSWVKVHDTSTSRQTTNPFTTKTSTPAAITLNELTSYASATLNLKQGLETEGSTAMYRLEVTVPIIPQGGYLKIQIDSAKLSSMSNAYCRVGFNFAKSTSDAQVLRCYRVTDGYIVAGFSAVNANTVLQVFFHAKSLIEMTSESISIIAYGIYEDTTSLIATASPVSLTHSNDSFPSTLGHVEKTVTDYDATWYNTQQFYEIEGSLNLRNADMGYDFRVVIDDPSTEYGDHRMWVKKNDSSVTGWT